jgi:hypothetical protein
MFGVLYWILNSEYSSCLQIFRVQLLCHVLVMVIVSINNVFVIRSLQVIFFRKRFLGGLENKFSVLRNFTVIFLVVTVTVTFTFSLAFVFLYKQMFCDALGPSCSINKIDTTPRMPEFFWIHVYGFAILFASIVVLSILQFSIFVYQRGWKNVTKAAITLYGLLCLIGINRTVYLLLDPYRYRGILGPIVESILFGFAISCLAGIYILIILMWIKMYSATHYTKTLDYAVQNAWIAIAVIFIVELIYDIVRGIYAVGLSRLITLVVYTVVLGFGTLIIAILFLIYGHKMYRRLKLFSRNERTKQITMKRINLFAKTTSIITIVLIVMLANFLILQFFFGENIVIFLISHTFQRFFEFSYCLFVILSHWKTITHAGSKHLSDKERGAHQPLLS